LDDAPLEERRARAVEMRRVLPEAVLNEVGALDPAAIEQVRADAWPDVRDADEMADVLHTFIATPVVFLISTAVTRRHGASDNPYGAQPGSAVPHNSVGFWVSAEKAKTFLAVYPHAQFESVLPELPGEVPSYEDAVKALLTGWLMYLGPVTASRLAEILHLP